MARSSYAKTWEMRSKYCLAGVIVFIAIYVRFIWFDDGSINPNIAREVKIFSGSAVLALTVFGALSWDISRLDPSDTHSTLSLIIFYLVVRIGLKLGKRSLKSFVEGAKDIKSQQEKHLVNLLKANSDCLYGKEHKFREIKSVKEFRSNNKICTYKDFEPYIDKMCEGKENILTTSSVMFFSRTSGTTGKYKVVPFTAAHQKSVLPLFPAYGYIYAPVLKGAVVNLKKVFNFSFKPWIETTKGGLKIGPVTYLLGRHYPFYNYPKIVSEISNKRTARYLHGIFLLREQDIQCLGFLLTNDALGFFQYLEMNWDSLCNDIEHGTLNKEDLEIDPETLESLKPHLKADKTRADELRVIMNEGSVGLIRRLWPGVQYLRAIGTGSMELYTKLLQDTYLKGVIHLSGGYGGSEGLYGINTTTELNDPSFTLAYKCGFFEFIPEQYINDEDVEDKVLLAHEVQKGCLYELVVTNAIGLYRYRVGDVIKITSFINQCPVFEFQYRIGQMLNIESEKTTETMFYKSLVKSAADLKVSIVDYTACEDVYLYGIQAMREPSRKYILFIELNKKISQEDTLKFDEALSDAYEPYRLCRKKQVFGPMEVHQVQSGTFERLAQIITNNDTNGTQFKMSRTLRVKEHLNFLVENKM